MTTTGDCGVIAVVVLDDPENNKTPPRVMLVSYTQKRYTVYGPTENPSPRGIVERQVQTKQTTKPNEDLYNDTLYRHIEVYHQIVVLSTR